MTVDLTVDAVLVGRLVAFGPNGEPSGIQKTPCTGPVSVTKTGLDGDGQGDRKHHGGPEKALHHYPAEHYVSWGQCPMLIHTRAQPRRPAGLVDWPGRGAAARRLLRHLPGPGGARQATFRFTRRMCEAQYAP